ncbi:hypothetical protein GCM10009658_35460 [Planotetraspora silvatica]
MDTRNESGTGRESAMDVSVLTVAALRAEFPGWRIWHSSAGRLWATRNGRHLTDEEHGRGLCQTIDGDDASQLAQGLRCQEELAGDG